ncbi:Peroxiredoxin-2 [Homalodisca vitripennis]|nr:Peroxiredoxin-2 [Homalodisca vitripennis]
MRWVGRSSAVNRVNKTGPSMEPCGPPLFTSIHVGHSCLVKVQHPAPAFKGTAVVDGDFKEIDICDFRGQYLVLFFYPLDFTFVCPTEIIAFSDRIKDFKAINTAVVGVSCDSHFSHLAWINTPRKHGGLGELKYPLLADFNKTIARDYNVLLEDDGVPLRGLFIIDPQVQRVLDL